MTNKSLVCKLRKLHKSSNEGWKHALNGCDVELLEETQDAADSCDDYWDEAISAVGADSCDAAIDSLRHAGFISAEYGCDEAEQIAIALIADLTGE